MTSQNNTRRDFIKNGTTIFGASWLGISLPQVLLAAESAVKEHQAAASYRNITTAEAIELGAMADQIIPEDETPGAVDVGVVYFIDYALGDFMTAQAPVLRQGLYELQQSTQKKHKGVDMFSKLPLARQSELLKSIEDTPFFGMVHFLTVCGMFALPGYGGNMGHAGWELLGFNHQHAWQPPFGHYDAAVFRKAAIMEEGN